MLYILEAYTTIEKSLSEPNAKTEECIKDTFRAARDQANNLILNEGYNVCKIYEGEDKKLVAVVQKKKGISRPMHYIVMYREPAISVITELCKRLLGLMNQDYIRIWCDGEDAKVGTSFDSADAVELSNQQQGIILGLIVEVIGYFTKPVFAINIYNSDDCMLYYFPSMEEKGSLEVSFGGVL